MFLISEEVAPKSPTEVVTTGSTFKLRLNHTPPFLETCELVPPSTTSDRYYERDPEQLKTCGYKVPNVKLEDTGIWTLIAVGKIAYKTEIQLEVVDTFL